MFIYIYIHIYIYIYDKIIGISLLKNDKKNCTSCGMVGLFFSYCYRAAAAAAAAAEVLNAASVAFFYPM